MSDDKINDFAIVSRKYEDATLFGPYSFPSIVRLVGLVSLSKMLGKNDESAPWADNEPISSWSNSEII
ncbi:hypothetical protein OGATHE_000183 [Ogataea polymorpha]|uniref:Uncharacterized protein n=1 Tax=Ogataea polymorpha TaxID=460523 RepID=A0A9P8TGE4_9ASCO|nr:hypothetical protein OGATHE_000183 [Ogataea polymorpha]